jgi:hypothetical protein
MTFLFTFDLFKICSYMHTLFVPFLPAAPCLLYLPPPPRFQAEPVCPLFQFCWTEDISNNKKDIAFLLVWDMDSYRETLNIASMHLYITTRIGSSLPDLFTTSWSPSQSDLCHFKVSILTPLQCTHQTLSSFGFPTFPCSSCMCFSLSVH